MEKSDNKSIVLFDVIGITSDFSFDLYDRLLMQPLWNLITETLRYTRSYEDGLRVADKMLELSDIYRERMTQKQYLENSKTLLYLKLDMLDRLDRWDEYLKLWTELRERTDLVYVWNNVTNLRNLYGNELDEWIIREDSEGLHLQFLWGIEKRKTLIEKKLHKQKSGGKLGNMLHAQREQLSEDEIKQRYEFMLRKADYIQKIDTIVESLTSRF